MADRIINGYYYLYVVNLPAHYSRIVGFTGDTVTLWDEYPPPGTYGPMERMIICYNSGVTTTTTGPTSTSSSTTTTTLTETTSTTTLLPSTTTTAPETTTSSSTTTSTQLTDTTTSSLITTTSQAESSTTTAPPTTIMGPVIINEDNYILEGVTVVNPSGHCIVIEGATNITIRNSTIGPCVGAIGTDNGKAIYALNSRDIWITGNHFVESGRNAVQFDKVDGGIISRNTVLYPQGSTNAEDLINLFASHNILVDGNVLQGGGPSDSGSCIMLGDGDGTNQTVINNVCTDPGQVGIGVAGGINIRVEDNTIRSAPYPWSNVGGYIWNQYGECRDILWANNTIEWYNAAGQRNDFWNGGGCTLLQP